MIFPRKRLAGCRPCNTLSVLLTAALLLAYVSCAKRGWAQSYCAAGSSSCDYEYITGTYVGNISNPSGCDQYGDYTGMSTVMVPGQNYDITVTNSVSEYPGDTCGIWVDWNQDLDFTDTGETIPVTGSPGTGPYTAVISPPVDAELGSTRMRVRIFYNQDPEACGTVLYGDAEDYSIEVWTSLCGDGTVTGDEACDDGNTEDCDGCHGDCTGFEMGCGDGFLCGAEACDDGNVADCDGCRGDCSAEETGCGDGYVCGGEACDDGDMDNCDACSNQCTWVTGCGDGLVCATEECDDGDMDNCDACSNQCTLITGCGDGHVCGAEVCDDGNNIDCDGCRGDCSDVETGCGDGYACGVEACDDGNLENCDVCSNQCTLVTGCGDGLVCATEECDDGDMDNCDACSNQCTWVTGCGDGLVCATEECDDGDMDNCDACSNQCTLITGCGDGHTCGAEACDDGDMDNCDACSNQCTLITGCGDGHTCGTEACDDGNVQDGDGCSGQCVLESQPTGSCCFQEGDCVVETEITCAALSGTYQGDDTLCVPDPCPQREFDLTPIHMLLLFDDPL